MPKKPAKPAKRTDANPWVIEFRNGFYFRTLDDDHSVSIEQAMRFPTMRAADDFVTKHEWILFNGGMPIEICAKCSKRVRHRGQVHCQ